MSSIRVYKDKKTFDTTLVIDGEKYLIGEGTGPWGVVDISLYEADGREFIIYTYSRKFDKTAACLAVFDCESQMDIFVSPPFYGFDLIVGPKPLEGNVFEVSSMEHWEGEDGGTAGSLLDNVGSLIYENGEWFLVLYAA